MPQPYPQFPTPAGVGAQEPFELSWELFGELCRVLALQVARDFAPEMVIGIAKAGVLPAAIIASILRIDFYCMKISRRSGDEIVREQPEVLSAAPPQAARRRVLLVDEITTSGDTLRLGLAAVRSTGPAEVRTATAFARTGGGYRPDYFALETEALVIFPWDRQVLEGGELVPHPAYRGIAGSG
jgi:hypoxanthine phosphoribosyltransferase